MGITEVAGFEEIEKAKEGKGLWFIFHPSCSDSIRQAKVFIEAVESLKPRPKVYIVNSSKRKNRRDPDSYDRPAGFLHGLGYVKSVPEVRTYSSPSLYHQLDGMQT